LYLRIGRPFSGPNVTFTVTATDGSTSSFFVAALDAGATSLPEEGQPQQLVVASITDDGYGTLRWALETARYGDVIAFDSQVFPPDDPAAILLKAELPAITCGGLTIDASNAGVVIDGSHVPGDWNNGLQVYSSDNTVMGLQIVDFAGSGIVIGHGAYNTIGGDRNIGLGPIGQGNLTSGNTIGIDLCGVGTHNNAVLGNLVGMAPDGTTPWGNDGFGVLIEDNVHNNVVGPENVIAANARGIAIVGAGALRNLILMNSIHSNTAYGIQLSGSAQERLSAPLLMSFALENGAVEGIVCPNCRVEVFSDHGEEGEYYEGCTEADSAGRFVFHKGSAFLGPNLTAVAIDKDGNSSRFSNPTYGVMGSVRIQGQSDRPRSLIQTMPSGELADNRIGDFPEIRNTAEQLDYLLQTGFTWQKVELLKNVKGVPGGEFWEVDWHNERYSLDPADDAAITELANSGVNLIACLGCLLDQFETAECGRFKTESEVQLFLSYVRGVVQHFKGRIGYYDIWNEPNNRVPNWFVEVLEYVELARRAIAVIHEEDPAAKIVVGSVAGPESPEGLPYMLDLLGSELMPLADIVAWHPTVGTSPSEDCYCSEYYFEYPTIIQEFKRIASAHGFEGEYRAAEINWRTPGHGNVGYWQPTYSAMACAKYYARGVLMHLGMDVMAGVITWGDNPIAESVFRYLCTLMAGHEAVDMSLTIAPGAPCGPLEYAAFRYPSGDRMMAVWRNVVAHDEDNSVPATVVFPGLTAENVTGIDALHGFEQELVFEIDGEDTIIRDLLVKDYPILIRLSDITLGPDYEETVGDGFHRLGDVDAVPSSTGSNSDRDGDGVPDDEDFCPDWPGSPETSGC